MAESLNMGLRLSFGFGPLRASVPLTSRRRKRKRYYYGKAPGWRCSHHHQTLEVAEACARRHVRATH